MNGANTESDWYLDAVQYQFHVKVLRDNNGDGFGDCLGLIHQLDSRKQLSVNCIWLLPAYPAPLIDDGMVSSYRQFYSPVYA